MDWVKSHPWLHYIYSRTEDGAYCKACALFAPEDVSSQKLGVLVSKPFRTWTKQSSMFHTHKQSSYHQDSMPRMLAFKEMYAAPARGVNSMLNKEWEEQIRNNTAILRSPLECVLFCG